MGFLREHMWLDEATVSHLELFRNTVPGGAQHTLFAVLNRTVTPIGARLLRQWMAQPLMELEAIEKRLGGVAELMQSERAREAIRKALQPVKDLERIVGRVSLPTAQIADVVQLREALGALQFLPGLLEGFSSPLLQGIFADFDPLEDVYHHLRNRLLAEPALKLSEGGYINAGLLPELDRLRELSRNSRQVISAMEAAERESTGIGSLKIRYNRVFGYYLEISKLHQAKVPPHYHRKQTLVNAERYSTPELRELEEQILGAEEGAQALELAEFTALRTVLGGYARRLQQSAAFVACLDVLAALAEAARENGYTRPRLSALGAGGGLAVQAGRHPVIERIAFDEPFIANDLHLERDDCQIMLITGPNMAGKSTVMRQAALIQLMAQMGSFVPAEKAELPLVDRIFTRVGASDNLSRGQSTFMLEMNEAANILNNATGNSLVVLDEIGRGTSTYDGISIAWAMVEHLHSLGALTLFATHYHELTQLAKELPRLKNYSLSITEDNGNLVFTRKLIAGESDKSYGIQVARMAGLPAAVVARAHEVMDNLDSAGNGAVVLLPQPGKPGTAEPRRAALARQQLSFLSGEHPVLDELRALNLETLTPLDALNYLNKAQQRLHKKEDSE